MAAPGLQVSAFGVDLSEHTITDARRQHRGSRWTSVRAKSADVDELIEVHRRRHGRSRTTRGLAGAPIPEHRGGGTVLT